MNLLYVMHNLSQISRVVEGWQKFEKEKGDTEGGKRQREKDEKIHRYAVRRE